MKRKVNGIIQRLTRIKGELLEMGAEYGDVDNYIMHMFQDEMDRLDSLIEEIRQHRETL